MMMLFTSVVSSQSLKVKYQHLHNASRFFLFKCQYQFILQQQSLLKRLNKYSSSSTAHQHSPDITGPSTKYKNEHKRSITNLEEYWNEAASEITWFKKYNKVLDKESQPKHGKWFCGGELNMCYNALDRHVENGLGNKIALIYDSPVTKTTQSFSYKNLLESVSHLAAQLVSMGVRSGDRVLIYMPMIPEAIHAMLACARIGATHVYVFGGFAAKELSTRIKHTEPKVIMTASCGIEPTRIVWYKPILDEAIRLASLPSQVQCLIYQRPNFTPAKLKSGRDFDWNEAVQRINVGHDCIPVDSDHPLYIMYTSGTTGMPKGIVRATGGHAVALPWTMKTVYNINSEEIWWAASDLGWVVGHSYICYGPLLSGLTSVLYEGKPVGTPDAAQYYRVIRDHQVNGMFTAPTALRAIRKEDPDNNQAKDISLKSLKHVFLAGERCDNDTRVWAEKSFQVPVIDHFWQTESGHPITAVCAGLDSTKTSRPIGTGGVPLPGYQMEVRLDDGSVACHGELGRLICKLPMPPGFMKTLHKADDIFVSTYLEKYPGYYDTMDAGFIDEFGYVHVMARDDDVINVAGHRLSTSSIEETILEHEDIADVAVVGVPDVLKGQLALALYVIVPGCTRTEAEITTELIQLVRETLGPVTAFKLAVAVPALPRTRSGKTPRKSIAQLAEKNASVQIPPTIEDASVYNHIIKALNKLGYGKNSTVKY